MEPTEENTKPDMGERINSLLKEEKFAKKREEISFNDYIHKLCQDPRPARTAFQRVYDMVISAGKERFTEFGEEFIRYKFFENLDKKGRYTEDSLFGLEKSIMKLVKHLRRGANKWHGEKRLILLEGPVGSAKSTIARRFKRGLENDSLLNPVYSFRWGNLGPFGSKDAFKTKKEVLLFDHVCQLKEEPLKLLDSRIREEVLDEINSNNEKSGLMKYEIDPKGDLCPHCQFNYEALMEEYGGDWQKMIDKHITVYRFFMSEANRIGITTFEPRDEKNQDSTELTGNIDYRKIAILGSDSDPRAFNFDGEFHSANRGLIEFVEVLKLDEAFLYSLLGTQEQVVKPKKHAQTAIDEVILSHTNEPELNKLMENDSMEAFRDRTNRVKVPYNLKLSDEIKIYEKDFSDEKLKKHKHVAPHTREVAAMLAVMSRLEKPKEVDDESGESKITLMQKLKLYNGQEIADVSEDKVRELKETAQNEGLSGLSPRFLQDSLGDALANDDESKCVNAFMVLHEAKENLQSHILIKDPELRSKYAGVIQEVEKEFEAIVKDEMQKIIGADENRLDKMCSKYLTNITAYKRGSKIKDKFTNQYSEADEDYMRGIEEKIGITEQEKDEFRTTILNHVGALRLQEKTFDFKTSANLYQALVDKAWEDNQNVIEFESVLEGIASKKDTEQFNVIKNRLIAKGYCEDCATDVLLYAASIFRRGAKKK